MLEQDASGPRNGCIRVRWIYRISQMKFECDCCEMPFLGVCGVRQNFYVFSFYRNKDPNVRIFDCLLTLMVTELAGDARASFLFVGDLIGHHQDWLGTMTTNRHGVAAFQFKTVSSCDQLVVRPIHARGETLDLLMTDVPDLVQVGAVAPIGNSDHSSLSACSHFDGSSGSKLVC